MLSDELKLIYTVESSARTYNAITLSHSLFTQDWHFVQDTISHEWELSDNTLVTFNPLGMSIVNPTIGSNQQDMQIVLDNTNLQLVGELNLAAQNISESIVFNYNVYIDGFLNPQASDIKLTLRNIRISKEQLSATASSKDTIGKGFLSEKFDARFKGLFI